MVLEGARIVFDPRALAFRKRIEDAGQVYSWEYLFGYFAVRLLAVRFNVRSRPLVAFEEDWRGSSGPGKPAP